MSHTPGGRCRRNPYPNVICAMDLPKQLGSGSKWHGGRCRASGRLASQDTKSAGGRRRAYLASREVQVARRQVRGAGRGRSASRSRDPSSAECKGLEDLSTTPNPLSSLLPSSSPIESLTHREGRAMSCSSEELRSAWVRFAAAFSTSIPMCDANLLESPSIWLSAMWIFLGPDSGNHVWSC